jgi:peptidoglycan hydrolase-like protein with peptidoglycan-binding domain
LERGRLIVTGHSGGGAPVSAILTHSDPDEVHIFDGTYASGANIVRWARRRIESEVAQPAARPPALRVLYIPGSQTAPYAEAIARDLRAALQSAAAARLRKLFRVDATKVAHGEIPRRFGWRLLADAAVDLPDARTYGAVEPTRETTVYENLDREPYSHGEHAEQESIPMSDRQYFAAEETFDAGHEGAFDGHRSDEHLAWLDMESEGADEWRGVEHESGMYTEDAERFEPFAAPTEYAPDHEGVDSERDTAEADTERFGEVDGEGDAEWEDELEHEAQPETFEQSWETWAERSEYAEHAVEGQAELAASGLSTPERKAVEITSTFETGKRGGFYGLSGNFDGQGLSFGLVNWTIGTGSLQPLLRDFAAEQRARWDAVFGADAARFLAVISPTGEAARREQHRCAIEQMNTSTLRNGKRVWSIREPWVSYFKRLAADPEFRKIQVRYVRRLLARAEYFCRYFSLKSEAAFAFMFDAVASHGRAWLTKSIRGRRRRQILLRARLNTLEQQHGKGRIPERDVLLAIADVLGATSAPRWAAKVRVRKRWFVGGHHPRASELRGLEPRLDVPYSTSTAPAEQRFAEAFEPAESPFGYEDEQPAADMTALETLLETEAGVGTGLAERVKGVAAFVLGPTLQRGSAGPGVETLQRCLALLGYAVAVDGKFGPGTEQAVRAFQGRSGLTADGVCGPRTKAAIAAAVGGGAAPTPVPVPPAPLPVPTPSGLPEAIARVAEEEYRRWHSPGKLRETDRAAVPILQQYYREGVNRNVSAAELQDTAWQQQHPWSAVFVSFVMRKAGAGAAFKYSAAHQGYVAAARRNRLQNVTTNPFWAYRATEVAPQVGDLVCASRSNSGATYDNIGDAQARATHCDVVTEVRPGSIRVVGGNVNQNVDAKTIRTLPDGRLALDGNQARFFAVLRCRGPIGATVQPPAPQPIPPQPTPAPPVGKKLTPAQFVAAYGASARKSQEVHGVPALVTLGQAALESGWGEHAPRFNFFGIKAKASDPEHTRQLLRTREVLSRPDAKFPEVISVTPRSDGKYNYIVRDWFRAYPDAAAAFDAHGRVLRLPRYAKAFTVARDPYAFAAEIARAKYATDPSYERVLTAVMRTIEKAGGSSVLAREDEYYGEAASF